MFYVQLMVAIHINTSDLIKRQIPYLFMPTNHNKSTRSSLLIYLWSLIFIPTFQGRAESFSLFSFVPWWEAQSLAEMYDSHRKLSTADYTYLPLYPSPQPQHQSVVYFHNFLHFSPHLEKKYTPSSDTCCSQWSFRLTINNDRRTEFLKRLILSV